MWRSIVDGPLKVCVHRIQRSARTLGRRCRSIDVAADIRYLSVCRRSVSIVDFMFFLASGMLAVHHRAVRRYGAAFVLNKIGIAIIK